MPEFLWYALSAGLLVAIAAGPLGAFIVWQRMSFFGDTLAHSALLGVALGLLVGTGTNVAVIASCMAVAVALVVMHEHTGLAQDNLLAIIAHNALALGLFLRDLGNGDRQQATVTQELANVFGCIALNQAFGFFAGLIQRDVFESAHASPRG